MQRQPLPPFRDYMEEIARRSGKLAYRLLDKMFGGYIRVFADFLFIPLDVLSIRENGKGDLDSRLRKLDVAREALEESLTALDELKQEATSNERRHRQAVAELASTLESKESAERKLAAVQKAMEVEVGAFQLLAGVPDVRKERLIGFASGVVASVIASFVFLCLQWLWTRYIGQSM